MQLYTLRNSALPLLIALAVVLPVAAQDTGWFSDQTAATGLVGREGFRIYVVDIDLDEYPDLVLENGLFGRNQLSLYLNRQNPESENPADRIFVDATAASGINANRDPEEDGRQAELAVMADIDNDGDIDMITGCYYHRLENYTDRGDRSEVLLNDGNGVFTIVENSGLPELGLINVSGLALLDYDLDGILDLYIATWSKNHTLGDFEQDFLLRGNGDGSFTDVSAAAGIAAVRFPMYGVNVTDWNNDGWPDIITSPYCRSGGSVWRNNGDGSFTDVAALVGYDARQMPGDNGQALCQWEALPADYDNDGDMDLALIFVHGGLDAGEGRSTLAVNRGPEQGYFLEWQLDRLSREKPSSVHLGDQDAIWFDADNDGLLDLVISQSVYIPGTDRFYIFRQDREHDLKDITNQLGLVLPVKATHAMEPLDYDLDGDDDLLVAKWRPNDFEPEQNGKLVLLRNDIGQQNFWLGIKLLAPPGVNRNAIGARITVHSGERALMREIQAGRGHFGGQQPFTLNVGLGSRADYDTVIVDSVVVRWPARGMRSVIKHPPVNTTISIDGNHSVAVGADAPPATELMLYPNPVQEQLGLRLPQAFHGRQLEVEITNILGQNAVRSIQREAVGGVLNLPLGALPAGAYVLRIRTANGQHAAAHFLKR